MTPAQIATLKTELQNDPRGYGYNAAARNDSAMAATINTARDGTNPPSNPTAAGGAANGQIKVNNQTADTGSVRAAITKAAYDGLTTGDRSWLNWFTGAGTFAVSADNLQTLAGVPTAAGSVWSTGTRTAMNAAMDALLRKNGSRAEELFGVGVAVTIADIGLALNS